MSLSRTAITVALERYEIEALCEWHREQEFKAADKREYAEASDHERRQRELGVVLKENAQ